MSGFRPSDTTISLPDFGLVFYYLERGIEQSGNPSTCSEDRYEVVFELVLNQFNIRAILLLAHSSARPNRYVQLEPILSRSHPLD